MCPDSRNVYHKNLMSSYPPPTLYLVFPINTTFSLAGLPEIRVEAYLRAGPIPSCWWKLRSPPGGALGNPMRRA